MSRTTPRYQSILSICQPLIISIGAYFLIVGPRALNPSNIAWLVKEDTTTHYLGWLFFRHSDWTFPIGLNPNYGLEISNSIVFSDSIPLLAFLFKPFSPLLPGTFQYFGIWLLACFILHAVFSWKLLSIITQNRIQLILGTTLTLFAPPMMWRLHGHFSLFGHFFIIASLYLAVRPDQFRRKLCWGLLLTAVTLVHAYLLAMVLLVWTADLIGKKLSKTLPIRQIGFEFLVLVGVTGIACWQAGYFNVAGGVSQSGYGYYRMNALSAIDCSGWSYILRDIPEGMGDYEGFNFLGLGLICLLLSAIPAIIGRSINLMSLIKRYYILGISMICLTLFAITNNVGLGPYNFSYPLPDAVNALTRIFRSSGRLFWPVFHVFVFFSIYLVVRGYKKRVAAVLIGLAVFIQIIDTHAGWGQIRKQLMRPPASSWQTPLIDPFWKSAALKYAKIRSIPVSNQTRHWAALSTYAGKNGLATDAVYLARIDRENAQKAQIKAMEAIKSGRYEKDALYVIDPRLILQAFDHLKPDSGMLAMVDNFFVLAPEWEVDAALPPVKKLTTRIDLLPPITLDERMPTSHSGTGLPYLRDGWSDPEAWGIWSGGTEAVILLPVSQPKPKAIDIEIEPLLTASHPKQEVEITINGRLADRIQITHHSTRVLTVKIPDTLYETENVFNDGISILFRFKDAVRPKDIGLNDDPRLLAIGILAFTIR